MTDSRTSPVLWRGALVGEMTHSEFETLVLFEEYKIKGRWLPLANAHYEAFRKTLAMCEHVEVSVDFGQKMEPLFGPNMRTLFSLASDDEVWLYVRDLEGPSRLVRTVGDLKASCST